MFSKHEYRVQEHNFFANSSASCTFSCLQSANMQDLPITSDASCINLVSGTRKFDRGLSRLLHVNLHWLDIPDSVQYKLGVTVRRCQQHKAPQYLIDCVMSASDIASRQRLRSASNFLCRVIDSAHLVVGPSLSLDQ